MNKKLDEYLKNMIPESPEDELIKMIYFFSKFHLRGDYSESNMVKIIKGYVQQEYRKGFPLPKLDQTEDRKTF